MVEKHSNSKSVLLLPLMANGHLKPFLELATQLSRRTTALIFTILSTPLNIQLLRQMSLASGFSDTSCGVKLVELPFESTEHGLPDQAENANVLPPTAIVQLLYASKALEEPLRRFIAEEMVEKEGCPPLCIISDMILGWPVGVARSFGSLAFTFTTAGAYGSIAYASVGRHLPHRDANEEGYFCMPGFPETHRFHLSQLNWRVREANGTDEWSMYFQPHMYMSMASDGWLCNTVEELEPLGMSILRSYLELPVWAIASTTPTPTLSPNARPKEVDEKIIEWLDRQPEDSVVYISFGSQNTISPRQMMELASGLMESERRFVWVIRPPFGFNIQGDFKLEWLPEGFERSLIEGEKRGILVHQWAPQREILSHKSIGAFITHCGWNSVLESLSHGVPMIGWPLGAEQAFNSKMLEEELGLLVELTRGIEGNFSKRDVNRVLNIVLDRQDKGLEMKRNANEASQTIRMATKEAGDYKGSSFKALDDFLNTLLHQVSPSSVQF